VAPALTSFAGRGLAIMLDEVEGQRASNRITPGSVAESTSCARGSSNIPQIGAARLVAPFN
jgi:hypothetical protein